MQFLGRFDGGVGQWLRGDARGGFSAVPPAESGLVVTGEVRAVAAPDLNADGVPDLLFMRRGAPPVAFVNQGRPAHR